MKQEERAGCIFRSLHLITEAEKLLNDIIWEDEIQNKKDEVKNKILTSLNKQIKQYFRSRNLVNSEMEVSDVNQANGSELSD